MKKIVVGVRRSIGGVRSVGMLSVFLILVMLVLTSSLVLAASSSSVMRRTFVVAEKAVTNEAVFLSPEEVSAMQKTDAWNLAIVVVGIIAIVVVLYLIIKKWLRKKPRVGKSRISRRGQRKKGIKRRRKK